MSTSYSRCGRCNAEIIFVRSPANKVIALDAKPVPGWVLEALVDSRGGSPRATTVQVRRAHRDTCPEADEHRSQR